MANFKEVSESFLAGATEGISSGQGNLKIKGDLLIHYYNPILERYNDKYILNMTRYSLVTGRLQKQLKELIADDQLLTVTHVPEGYKKSLQDFIVKSGGEQ